MVSSIMLEPAYRDVYCSPEEPAALQPQKRGRGSAELETSLSLGQYVLCRWSDGLYYLGKIQRVSGARWLEVSTTGPSPPVCHCLKGHVQNSTYVVPHVVLIITGLSPRPGGLT